MIINSHNFADIKAISFDVDGTLWDFEAVMRNALKHTLAEMARLKSEAAAKLNVERMAEIRERVHAEGMDRGTKLDLWDIRRRSIQEALIEAGHPDNTLADHLFEAYVKHRHSPGAAYDDALPAIDALRGRYKLGLPSNGNSRPAQFGMADRFDFWVYAADHGGIEKPDPRIFRIAAQAAGVLPEEMLHVGDNLESDIAGANNAGVPVVWVNRLGLPNYLGATITAEVSSLAELVKLL